MSHSAKQSAAGRVRSAISDMTRPSPGVGSLKFPRAQVLCEKQNIERTVMTVLVVFLQDLGSRTVSQERSW